MRGIALFLLLVFAVDSQARDNLTIWSKLPTVAKTKQLLLYAGAAAWLGCATFGCSVPAPVSEPPAVAVQEEKTGIARLFHQNIHFRVDGRSYRGRATDRLVGDDEIVVKPRHEEAERVIAIEDISGVQLADHWLMFALVRAPMNERGLRSVQGRVVAIYTDGYAAVSVSLEIDRRYDKHQPQKSYDAFFPIKQLTVLEEEKKPTFMAAQ